MGTENRYIRHAFLLFKLSKISFSGQNISLNFVKQCIVHVN